MICLDCRYAEVIEDSKGKYHNICTKVESPRFMTPVSILFGSCDEGEPEEDEE